MMGLLNMHEESLLHFNTTHKCHAQMYRQMGRTHVAYIVLGTVPNKSHSNIKMAKCTISHCNYS